MHQRARGRRLASVCKHRLAVALAICLVAAPGQLRAQGELAGRVLTDSGRTPVASVQVSITRLGQATVTDSVGHFRLTKLPPGDHLVVFRALGFRPDSQTVEIEDDVAVRDFILQRQVQTLPKREVVGESPPLVERVLSEYYERRKLGIGHLVTREELAKAEGGVMKTSDVISKVPGTRQYGNYAGFIASGRAVSAGGCAFCGAKPLRPEDVARGARAACYMDVYLDGALVYNGNPSFGLFDVNALEPASIEAIEVFTSAAQVPVKYNRTSNGCGVLLIWTRRSP